ADGSPLPRWLRFNSQTMAFSGRPLVRDVGQYDVRVTATDSGSPALATSSEFTISVVGHPFRAQNADLPQDVDGNELVTPRDALILINWINANGPGPAPDSVPETVEGSLSFVDVNGDDAISPMDVLMVVNHLNHPSLTSVPLAEGEGTIATTSPRATPTLHAPFTETPFTETPFTETLRRTATTVDLAFSQNTELSSPADLDELLGVLAHDTGRGETECDDLAMVEIV
ncbi:MAG: dockerin type I domain-containing protein, partial [Pirellulaceae bacterium]|nr:dockerin type I domain-containing protein [Pirellulaceae bacterium]